MKYILYIIIVLSLKESYSQGCLTAYYEANTVCSGEEIILGVSINDQSSSATYTWTLNGNFVSNASYFTTSVDNNSTTNLVLEYIMSGETSNNCTDVDTVTITVYPKPSIETQVVNPSCPYVSGVTDWGSVNVSSNLSISVLYQLNPITGIFESLNSNNSISSLQAGSYYVYLEGPSPLYCRSDTVTVDISNPPSFIQPTITYQNDNCGQGTGAIVINGLSGGTPPYTFTNSINNSIYATPISDSVITGLAGNSTYYITLTDVHGCSFNLTPNTGVIIGLGSASPPAQPIYDSEYSVCYGDSLLLVDSQGANNGLRHIYTFNTYSIFSSNESRYLGPTYLQEESVVNIRAIGAIGDANAGCYSNPPFTVNITQKNCDTLTEDKITINAFTPNGSIEENTIFNINLDYIKYGLSNVVTIYNRWGDVIYKIKDYDNMENVWNGDNQSGESMPEGTYFYVVEVPSKNFSTSGWVYLDR